MTRTRLLQLSGLAGLVGGVLLVLLDIAFLVFFGDEPERTAAATTTWLVLLDMSILAAYLILMALIGLYARQVDETGRLGLATFILASLGTVLNIGFLWGGGFIVPAPDIGRSRVPGSSGVKSASDRRPGLCHHVPALHAGLAADGRRLFEGKGIARHPAVVVDSWRYPGTAISHSRL
ncbi:MAG: hypothetical protein JSW55_06270 [Chloroflexota bacterium]|nr:MAG: hypothetical protein JSW55_06270 [Chloroflexota bacterium]